MSFKGAVAIGMISAVAAGVFFFKQVPSGSPTRSFGYEVFIVIAFLVLVALFVRFYDRSIRSGISSAMEDTERIFKTTADSLGLAFYSGRTMTTPESLSAYPQIRGSLNGFDVRISVYQNLGYDADVTELYTAIEISTIDSVEKQLRDRLDVPIGQFASESKKTEFRSRIRIAEQLYAHHPLPVSLPPGRLQSRIYKSELDNGRLRILIRNRENAAGLFRHPAPYDLEVLILDAVAAYEEMKVSSES